MLDFTPNEFWEYGKGVFYCILIGAVIGFVYTYAARKLIGKNEVQKYFRGLLYQFVLISIILCAFSLLPRLGSVSFSVLIFMAVTELVRFLAIPWAAVMVVEWKYIPPWKLLNPDYYKKRRHDDEQ